MRVHPTLLLTTALTVTLMMLGCDSKPVTPSTGPGKPAAGKPGEAPAPAKKVDPAKAAAQIKAWQDQIAAYPATADGLRDFASEMMKAHKERNGDKVMTFVKSMALADPDAWFKATFGDAQGAALSAAYKKEVLTGLGTFPNLLEKMTREKKTIIKAYHIKGPDDENAKGLQKQAFGAMTKKTDLFTIKFFEEGKTAGLAVWSFAHVDNGFRFIGKLQGVKATEGAEGADGAAEGDKAAEGDDKGAEATP